MVSSSEEDTPECPLCLEELDATDRSFLPCPCGYQVCLLCFNHILKELNGKCPACRTPYDPDNYQSREVEQVASSRKQKRKEKQEAKKQGARGDIAPSKKELNNVRVIQRNLVYMIGIPPSLAREDLLRRREFFGQYGKILKVVANRNQQYNTSGSNGPSHSAYVTYSRREEALSAIQAVDGLVVEGRVLRASFGTTKYCSYFLRNVQCVNPDCMYLHELGHDEDSFTKEEMMASKHAFQEIVNPVPQRAQRVIHSLSQGFPPPPPRAALEAAMAHGDRALERMGKAAAWRTTPTAPDVSVRRALSEPAGPPMPMAPPTQRAPGQPVVPESPPRNAEPAPVNQQMPPQQMPPPQQSPPQHPRSPQQMPQQSPPQHQQIMQPQQLPPQQRPQPHQGSPPQWMGGLGQFGDVATTDSTSLGLNQSNAGTMGSEVGSSFHSSPIQGPMGSGSSQEEHVGLWSKNRSQYRAATAAAAGGSAPMVHGGQAPQPVQPLQGRADWLWGSGGEGSGGVAGMDDVDPMAMFSVGLADLLRTDLPDSQADATAANAALSGNWMRFGGQSAPTRQAAPQQQRSRFQFAQAPDGDGGADQGGFGGLGAGLPGMQPFHGMPGGMMGRGDVGMRSTMGATQGMRSAPLLRGSGLLGGAVLGGANHNVDAALSMNHGAPLVGGLGGAAAGHMAGASATSNGMTGANATARLASLLGESHLVGGSGELSAPGMQYQQMQLHPQSLMQQQQPIQQQPTQPMQVPPQMAPQMQQQPVQPRQQPLQQMQAQAPQQQRQGPPPPPQSQPPQQQPQSQPQPQPQPQPIPLPPLPPGLNVPSDFDFAAFAAAAQRAGGLPQMSKAAAGQGKHVVRSGEGGMDAGGVAAGGADAASESKRNRRKEKRTRGRGGAQHRQGAVGDVR